MRILLITDEGIDGPSLKALEAVAGIDRSAKRIGLSNVHPNELRLLIQWVKTRQERGETNPPPRLPDVLQAYADPIRPAEELRHICLEHGIEFVSYSTLGTQHRGSSGNPILGSPVIEGLAAKHERSVAEVALSWALQNDMSVIPRSSKKQHILELARLLDDDPTFLDNGDLKMIDSMKYTST
jgi:diketogulonate reductase-like aldo/keto reductase